LILNFVAFLFLDDMNPELFWLLKIQTLERMEMAIQRIPVKRPYINYHSAPSLQGLQEKKRRRDQEDRNRLKVRSAGRMIVMSLEL
jgi:hypothetical protein